MIGLALTSALLLVATDPPASGTPSAPAPVVTNVARVLVLDFRDDGAGPEVVQLVRDAIATALGNENAVEVISSEDVRRMIAVENDKVATCNGNAADATAACLAEVGAALGARYIVYGSVGALGGETVINMSLTDSDSTRTTARRLVQVSDRAQIPREAQASARQLLIDAGILVPVDTGPSALSLGGGAAAGIGVLALGGGLVLAWLSDAVVADTVSSGDEKDGAEGRRLIGWVVAGVGTAALGAGATVAVLGWE